MRPWLRSRLLRSASWWPGSTARSSISRWSPPPASPGDTRSPNTSRYSGAAHQQPGSHTPRIYFPLFQNVMTIRSLAIDILKCILTAPWCSRKGCAAAARWRGTDRFPGRSAAQHRGKFAPKFGSELLFKFAASHLSMWITSFKLYSLNKHKDKVKIKYNSQIHLYCGSFQWVIKS